MSVCSACGGLCGDGSLRLKKCKILLRRRYCRHKPFAGTQHRVGQDFDLGRYSRFDEFCRSCDRAPLCCGAAIAGKIDPHRITREVDDGGHINRCVLRHLVCAALGDFQFLIVVAERPIVRCEVGGDAERKQRESASANKDFPPTRSPAFGSKRLLSQPETGVDAVRHGPRPVRKKVHRICSSVSTSKKRAAMWPCCQHSSMPRMVKRRRSMHISVEPLRMAFPKTSVA